MSETPEWLDDKGKIIEHKYCQCFLEKQPMLSKANQQEKISFRVEDLRKYFPKTYSVARIQERILKLLEADCRKRQRAQER